MKSSYFSANSINEIKLIAMAINGLLIKPNSYAWQINLQFYSVEIEKSESYSSFVRCLFNFVNGPTIFFEDVEQAIDGTFQLSWAKNEAHQNEIYLLHIKNFCIRHRATLINNIDCWLKPALDSYLLRLATNFPDIANVEKNEIDIFLRKFLVNKLI